MIVQKLGLGDLFTQTVQYEPVSYLKKGVHHDRYIAIA